MNVRTRVHSGCETDFGNSGALSCHAHWLLRAALAGVCLYHGLQKFFVMGIDGFAATMGLPVASALLVAVAEVLAGAGILAGATVRGRLGDIATRLSGLAIAPVLVGAIAMVHWGRWSFTPSESHPMGGMEFQVVVLLIGLYFLVRGNEA